MGVFGRGRLRLHLLTLLDGGPRHGYELIRLIGDRFQGRYTPSAGTIYPRLHRLEVAGLVRSSASGGRRTYELTDAGRAELAARAGEVAALEADIEAAVAAPLSAPAARRARSPIAVAVPGRAPWQAAPASGLEQHVLDLLHEVRRLDAVPPDARRAVEAVVETAVEPVRRLLTPDVRR